MIICHVCNAECDDSAEACPVCDAELVREAKEKAEEKENIMENPTLLCSFDDIVSAQIFKDILKDSGIPFTCSSEMGNNSIQVLFGGGFVAEDIYVSENDMDKANELLEVFNSQEIEFQEEFFEDGADTEFEDED